ncbi:hypothetical protein TB2_028849 [Malus domestica]
MALAVVGGAVLSGFFQQVFVKLDSQEVKNFISGKKRTGELLNKLETTLIYVHAVFDDAEEKQISNLAVRQWLTKLKEVVLDAEDLLDEIKTEALSRKMEAEFGSSTSTNKVQGLISASVRAFDETSIDSMIEEILERLGFVAKQKDAFHLKAGCKHRISQTLPSTSLVEGSDVYGRDKDKETIIKLLLSNDVTGSKIGVVPVFGMGGIGKTTLAQLVFNDDAVKGHFNLRAWVCVSEVFDVVKITQTLYGSVTSQNCDITDLNMLQVKLKEVLTRKKFLFVLDDVWNESYNDWDILRRPFESGVRGSKIIVTTRNKGVASMMGTRPTHHLMQILEEDCWLLFAKHAFENESGFVDPNQEVIGRQIVSKCKGLPLAAKSLGGLLRSESNLEEWKNILQSDIWELSDAKSGILPALWLSYQYLSPHLKRCFGYCSIFPKDYKFRKSELVLLWMAEDLLQPNRMKMMEEVGEKYFDDLVSRSFFQYSSYNSFIMHDLISDLAKFVSGKFCIRLEDICSLDDVTRARHFSYLESYDVDFQRFDTLYEAKYLRTFLLGYSLPTVRCDLLLKLQCLRVLKLQGHHMKELPDSVSNLKHLRYLNLCWTSIKKLPETIGSLCNLQTLLLSECKDLSELPATLSRLINLRHLDITGTKIKSMSLHLGKLKDLQTLGGAFVLDKHTGRNIVELKGFQQLRGTLHISGLHNIVHAKDALEAKMGDKKHLSEVTLKWDGCGDDSQKDNAVLRNLQPHTNLEVLTIERYGGTTFPSWLGDDSFNNLVSLRLEDCRYCFSMPPLGQLPFLKRLEIEGLNGVELVGSEFYGETKPAFRSLEYLRFQWMQEWQEWSFAGRIGGEGGDFPNLRELSVKFCPKLTGKLQLDCFPRLELLTLWSVNIESLASSQECDECHIELPCLRELQTMNCRNLIGFVGGGVLLAPKLTVLSMFGCKNLWSLPEEMHISLPSARFIHIENCEEFEWFPRESELLSLRQLRMSECAHFLGFRNGGRLMVPKLTSLKFCRCEKLRTLPEEIVISLPCLQSLSIQECKEFESFPEECNLPSLENLKILDCPNFVGFPHGGLHAPNLTKIDMRECEKLRSLPADMHSLVPSLEFLSISYCPELESFPEGGLPAKLELLKIGGCKKLIANRMQWGLQRLTSLRRLGVGFFECEDVVESFPEEGLLPATLTSLSVSGILDLKVIDGNELRHLISLEKFRIFFCPQLQRLPDEGLPTSLSLLEIWDCNLLTPRCQRETGEDWPKIAHIPNIIIDQKKI